MKKKLTLVLLASASLAYCSDNHDTTQTTAGAAAAQDFISKKQQHMTQEQFTATTAARQNSCPLGNRGLFGLNTALTALAIGACHKGYLNGDFNKGVATGALTASWATLLGKVMYTWWPKKDTQVK